MWNGPSAPETLGAPGAPRAPEGPLGPRVLEIHTRSYKGLDVEVRWGQGGPGPKGPRGPSWGPFHIKKKSSLLMAFTPACLFPAKRTQRLLLIITLLET